MTLRSNLLRGLPGALLLTILGAFVRPAGAGVDTWTPIGPDGGVIWALAADPEAPGTLYAGILEGGVWKSLDGGVSWVPTVGGLGAAGATALAASAGRVYAGSLSGLFLLTGGADAWRRVGPFPFSAHKLAVDPTNPDWIWAAGLVENNADNEVLLSKDGGEHWEAKLRLTYPFDFLAIAPTVPSTVYAGGGEGIFVSRDAGASWRQANAVFGDPGSAPPDARALAVDSLEAATAYVASYGGTWRTTDAASHWSHIPGDLLLDRLFALPGALLGFSYRLYRSENGGDIWDPVQGVPPWDLVSFAADPAAPGGAWLGGYGRYSEGLLHTADGGRTWSRLGRGLRASDVQAFAFDPFQSRTLYAVSPRVRLQRSDDAGASWSPTLTVLNIRSLAADPRRPATLYAGTPRGVFVSRDRGAHWQRILHDSLGIETVVVDPRRRGTIWAAGKQVWRSRDAGSTWKLLGNPIVFDPAASARRIFLPPGHPGTLYLIDSFFNFSRSTDGGATWERLDGFRTSLAFDRTQPDLLYATDPFGNILKSRDGGTTWEGVASSVSGDFGLTALLVDPLDPSVLYVGTNGNGILRSVDQGATWQSFSAGLTAPAISCLEADPRNPRRLVACAEGGGLLEIRTSSGS